MTAIEAAGEKDLLSNPRASAASQIHGQRKAKESAKAAKKESAKEESAMNPNADSIPFGHDPDIGIYPDPDLYPLLSIARPGDARPMDLSRAIKGYGTNLPMLLDAYCRGCNPPLKPGEDDTARSAAYHRLYRRLHRLAEAGLINLEKGDSGLLWAHPKPALLYLIRQEQNSNHHKTASCQEDPGSIFAWPNKTRPERIDAIRILNNHKMLPPDARKEIKILFDDYMKDIEDRRLVLGDPDNPDNLLILPYLNRFNNIGRKVELLKKYDKIFCKSREYYQDGVFLTLTTDPKRFKSLWHANRHFQTALNRFWSVLQKRFGFRLPYIAVYEFTPGKNASGDPKNSGLLHAHIILFGRKWIGKSQDISDIWSKCGQGEIVKLMALRNDPQYGWLWTRAKPEDAGGRDPQQYLKKYLVKALYDPEGFELYWSFNKRFYSYSRRLYDPDAPYRSPSGITWVFLGSWPWDSIPPMHDLETRYRPKPPPEAVKPPLPGIPESVAATWPQLSRLGRFRAFLQARGLLEFRSALDLYNERKIGALSGVAVPPSPAPEINDATGEPWQLSDFM